MKNFGARETRTDSEISELAKDESNELALPDESSSQGTRAMESVPSDWTDEKHHLFLESIEASFVSQLYSSMPSVGSSSLEENLSLHGQSKCDSHTNFAQFKVLRHGSWKNINFAQTNLPLKVLNESQVLSCSPWVHHFRAAPEHRNAACKSEAINTRGRNSVSIGTPSSLRPLRARNSHSFGQHTSNSNTEVSDQNFVDGDSEVEEESRVRNAKRIKIPETNASRHDQVVPSRQFHKGDDGNKNNISSG